MVRYIAMFSLAALLCAGGPTRASESITLTLDAPSLASASTPKTTSGATTATPPHAEAQPVPVKVGRVGMVQAPGATIRMGKSTRSAKYATVKADTPIAIVKEEADWYGVLMVNGAIGWVPRASVKMTGYELVANKPLPDRGTATSRGGDVDRTAVVATEGMVRTAMQYTGVRYVYGGTDPATGMDCSAFVRMIFAQYGVNLPRTAREQALVGTTVPVDQLQPGDRLYFSCKNSYIDHCGIYAGNGYFVHCSASRNGVGLDSLASDFYWRSLVVAKRS